MSKAKRTKFIGMVLAILTLLTNISLFSSAADTEKNNADALVAVAVSQLGYYERDSGYTKYGAAYGDSYMDWDCAFVLWCANEAGVSHSVIPNYLLHSALRSFFQSKNAYYVSRSHGSSFNPKKGDIVFFSLNSTVSTVTHVGIVESTTSTGFTAIEGDFKSKVGRATYSNSDKYVIGFARPDYTASDSPVTTYTTGTYTTNAAMNFRSVPNGTVIGLIPEKTKLKVTSVSGIWGQTTYNGKTGWISLEYSTPDGQEVVKTYVRGIYRVNSDTALYKTEGATKLKTVKSGSVINVTAISGKWGKLSYNGSTGYIDLTTCTFFTSANNEPVVITVPGSTTTVTKVEILPTEAKSVDWLVVDVSKWNATYECDWVKMKANGVKGVIIRIGGRGYSGSRTMYSDDTFYQHYKAAKAAGLHIGVYFYSYALNAKEAEEEAQFTIDMLKSYKCELDMPVYIDMEDYTGDWQHHNAGKAVCSTVLDVFCNKIAAAGYYPGIYTNLDFTKNLIYPETMNGRAVWIAHYSSTCGYTGRYEMWQYSQYGSIPGYTGKYIDVNHCYVNFPLLINNAYETAKREETVVIPEHTTVIDPTHEQPNTTPAGGMETTTAPDPYVDDTPSVTRTWKTVKKATCTTDGEKCLYQGNEILLSEIITAEHTKAVKCALNNSSVQLRAGEVIDSKEFASNFYTENSPYYTSLYNSIKSNGGCLFTFCEDCGEILEVEYIYKTNNCSHDTKYTTKKAATCAAEGLKIGKCSKCSTTTAECIIPRKAHTPGSAAVVKNSNGIMCNTISCKVCSTIMNATYASIKGDVDGDCKITVNDARYVIRYTVGFNDAAAIFIKNGDITGNGQINAADARKLLRIAVGLD